MGKVVKENYSQKQRQIATRAKVLQKYLAANINNLAQKNFNYDKLYNHCEIIAEYISDLDEISNSHSTLEK